MSAPLATYPPSHSWYYLLGHPVRGPKTILHDTQLAGFPGYRAEEIAAAHALAEPQRTRRLNALRTDIVSGMRRDCNAYRGYARQLRSYRQQVPEPLRCAEVHTALSLKYCHLANGFAHLTQLDGLPKQGDLFG